MQAIENPITQKYLKLYLATLGVIIVLGIIMVYSSSYIYAKEIFNSSSYYIIRQLGFLFIGIILAVMVGKTKVTFWIKYSLYFHIFCILLLFLTLVPVMGISVKGANRWINLGIIHFQPGEILKYSIMLSSIFLFERSKQLNMQTVIRYSLSLLLPLVLFIIQPDFGTFLICLMVIMYVCFMSSFRRKYFYLLMGSGIVMMLLTVAIRPYRVQRILSFLDPWKNAKTTGFQVIQSYLAFANGSFWGQGLGNSNEKLFYLPEAHNDFIFSVLGEELGFIGVASAVVLFILLLYWGFNIALSLRHRESQILVSSVIFIVSLQVLINMGVVLGMLPTKGLNLPFISYGGSSLVANFFGIGLIISAARYSKSITN